MDRSRLSSRRRDRRRCAISLAALCAILGLAFAAAPAQAIEAKFETTGEHEFIVPSGAYHLKVVLIGGIGGAAGTVSGGEAAEVVSGLGVTPGETLYIEVAGKGKSEAEGGAGGFNGGGDGAGGGGGASDIRTAPNSTPLSTEDTRLIVAAGGGGAGATGTGPGGQGGDAESTGEAGSGGYEGGGPGAGSEGGEGGTGCEPQGSGGDGSLGEGGGGGDSEYETGPGGGGGGGLAGGGGGAGACVSGSGGGGGGSSLNGGGLESLISADPKIDIIYNPPPTVAITTPANEGVFAQGAAVNANYSCLPGTGTSLESCTGPVANGAPLDTSTPGEHSFTVEAEDNDAGKASKTTTYTVIPPPSVGITSPANGATYTQGQAVTASYACHAAEGAELKSCEGPLASGAAVDTATLGTHTFDVDAEDSLGGKASKESSYTVVAKAPPVAPNTILGSHPKKTIKSKKKKVKVKFTFSSDVAGATFECKLDKGSFAPCTSPKTYRVKPGKHIFSVVAFGAGGADQTPATFKFKVKKKK